MYDATNEPNEFVGDDLESAIAKAARFYSVEESELKVVQPTEGTIAGVGSRTVVVAMPKDMKVRPPRGSDNDSGDRGGRGRGDRERGGRERGGRERGGRERGGRERGGRERGGRESGGRETRGDRGGDEVVKADVAKRPESSKGTAKGKLGDVGGFLLGVLERMNVGDFELGENLDGEYLVLELTGPGANELGSGDGRTLDAIQLLVNQAAMREEDAPRVVIDAEGSGDRRRETLERLAEKAAARALDNGRSIALDAMNGRDRRTIHIAIRETADVATMSIGEGRYRQVLVVPQGADEYDEAVAAQESD